MTVLIPASDHRLAAATIVVSFGIAAVYGFVAYRLVRRQVSPEARLASIQFSLWWGGLAASAALTGIEVALALGGVLGFPLALTLDLFTVLLDVTFLWGLVGFLVYVYTGKYHLVELTLFYAAFYVTALYYVLLENPTGVVLQSGEPTIHYTGSPNLGLAAIVVLGILVPVIAGGVAYLSLLRKTHDPTQRYRIWLVGGGILLWFALDAFFPSGSDGLLLLKALLELVPGIMSLIAYYPPDWVRERLRQASGAPAVPAPAEAATHP